MKKIIYIIFAVVCLFFTSLGTTFAWFINTSFVDPDVSGYTVAAYFGGGDGTSEEVSETKGPYIISNPRHLYNLAWLQYFGQFNTVENDMFIQTHFVVTQNINMDGYVLPPIGTTEYPFLGNFNGNGYIISNLTVSNNFEDFNNMHPVNVTSVGEETNILGMFGVIGKYTGMENFSSSVNTNSNNVTNFYLDNISINASRQNENSLLVGLFAGYVNANASNVGIHYSNISLAKNSSNSENIISNYTLIGDYNSDEGGVNWGDSPGIDYGSSLDVQQLYQRIEYINANKSSTTPSSLLPNIDISNTKLTIASGNYMPLTLGTNLNENDYVGDQAKEIPSIHNIGYFLGNQNKFNDTNITFSKLNETVEGGKTTYSWNKGTTPNTFFTRTGDNSTATSENIKAMTENDVANLPTGIKNLLGAPGDVKKYTVIRLQQKYEGTQGNSNGNYSNKGKLSYYGEEYDNVYLPNNGIWVKPKTAGIMRFVVYSGSNGSNFSIYKLNRTVSNADNLTEYEYLNQYFSSSITSTTDLSSSIHSYSLPLNLLFYFELEITDMDLKANNEYLLANDRGSGAYFLYLDVGTSSEGSSTTTSEMSKIDFVYIKNASFIPFEDQTFASNVYFIISGIAEADVDLIFKRDYNTSNNVVVFYSFISSNGITLSPEGSGSSENKTIIT